jgi:hypothetical protein
MSTKNKLLTANKMILREWAIDLAAKEGAVAILIGVNASGAIIYGLDGIPAARLANYLAEGLVKWMARGRHMEGHDLELQKCSEVEEEQPT